MSSLDYLFISNPRTGTLSINAMLDWGQRFNHCPAKMIRHELGAEAFERLFSFGLVRHPFDRLVSWYSYHKGLTIDYYNKKIYDTPFDEWVLAGCPHHWQYTPHVAHGWLTHPLHQWEYFYDGDREVVDFIGRYEQMPAAIATICERIGADPGKLKVSNSSQREPDYHSCFDDRTRQAAYELLRKDFEIFGYEP